MGEKKACNDVSGTYVDKKTGQTVVVTQTGCSFDAKGGWVTHHGTVDGKKVKVPTLTGGENGTQADQDDVDAAKAAKKDDGDKDGDDEDDEDDGKKKPKRTANAPMQVKPPAIGN